jgi:hypothetical protein
VKWSLHCGARVARGLNEVKRNANDLSLHERILRFTAGVAEREVSEYEARHAALLDDILRGTDNHSRNAVRLKVSSDQTHGLMTNRSERY